MRLPWVAVRARRKMRGAACRAAGQHVQKPRPAYGLSRAKSGGIAVRLYGPHARTVASELRRLHKNGRNAAGRGPAAIELQLAAADGEFGRSDPCPLSPRDGERKTGAWR